MSLTFLTSSSPSNSSLIGAASSGSTSSTSSSSWTYERGKRSTGSNQATHSAPYPDEIILHIFKQGCAQDPFFMDGNLLSVSKQFNRIGTGETESKLWEDRLKIYEQRTRLLSPILRLLPRNSTERSVYEKTKQIGKSIAHFNNKGQFRAMMQRIAALLRTQNLSLHHFFASTRIIDDPHLFEHIWSNLANEDMTPLILQLINIDLNEALLFLTYALQYKKIEVTVALRARISTILKENKPLGDFYLGMVIKEHLCDFDLFGHSFNNITGLFDFILKSRVVDLTFSDFKACNMNFWSEDPNSAIQAIVEKLHDLYRNAAGSLGYRHPDLLSPIKVFSANSYHPINNSWLNDHFRHEAFEAFGGYLILFDDFLTHLNKPEHSPVIIHLVRLLNHYQLTGHPALKEIVNKLPQELLKLSDDELRKKEESEELIAFTNTLIP